MGNHRLERSVLKAMKHPHFVSALKVDKDCQVDPDWINDWVDLVALPICRNFDIQILRSEMIETKKGLHLQLSINRPIHDELANRIQWLLGDDCRRVDFNRARIRVGYAAWNKLFEAEGVRVVELYPSKVAAATLQLPSRGDSHS